MTPENFCFWLQGYFELGMRNKYLTQEEFIIKEHLGLVFNKVTTNINENYSGSCVAGTNVKNPIYNCNWFGLENAIKSKNERYLNRLGIYPENVCLSC